jgi:hypothetical protein
MGFFSILHTIVSDNIELTKFGDKYITLFGNEYTSLSMIIPIYLFAVMTPNILMNLKKCTITYISIGLLFFILSDSEAIGKSILWVPVFYRYLNPKGKFLIILLFLLAIYCAFHTGARSYLFYCFFGIASIMIIYFKRLLFIKLFCLIFVLSPIILLIDSIYTGKSVFEKVSDNITDNEIGIDTRTFLYIEVTEDLTANNAWIWGKGAYSRYNSTYFNFNDGDNQSRSSIEVPILYYLSKGGGIYLLLYVSLLLFAIWYALFKGKNKFVYSIAIVVAGYFFCFFVSNLNGANFLHVGFWILVGCCYSKSILDATDEEISRRIKMIN